MGLMDLLKKVTGDNKATTLTVYISDNGKVYHSSAECMRNKEMKPIDENEAIARGLQKCKVCFNERQETLARNGNILDIIQCSLMGCTYPNPDGTSRQTYLVNCKQGQDVVFKPTPTKEYPDTVGVFAKKGCIGVLPYQAVNKLRGLYANNKASAVIKSIEKTDRGLFCTITITIYK